MSDLRFIASMACGLFAMAGCGNPDGVPLNASATGNQLTARHGTVIVEACVLQAEQMASLSSSAMHRVVSDVVLRCLNFDANGHVSTITPDGLTAARAQVDAIRALGYHVSYAVTTNVPNLPSVIAVSSFRTALAASLSDPSLGVDGIDVALPTSDTSGAAVLDTRSRTDLSSLVNTISVSVRPARTLAIWAPPSDAIPSDIPGGDAYDVVQLGSVVDRVRLMTLDYSCCNSQGPTDDSGWAVEVVRLARGQTTTPAFDLSLPLYGYRYVGSSGMNATPIGYSDAISAASNDGIQPTRDPRGPLTFTDSHGTWWFDDAQTTLDDLFALDPTTLPSDVGIVFYGLGAEDPNLWNAVSGALP